MIEIVLLVLLGLVLLGAGLWLCNWGLDASGLTGWAALLGSLVLFAAALIVPLAIGGAFRGQPDPCRYLISAKPVVYGYHHGHTTYGGRTVLCP